MLSSKQKEQVIASFKRAAGVDGRIDRNEFKLVIVRLKPGLSNSSDLSYISDAIFKQVDTNHTGYINVDEFLSAYPRLKDKFEF